MTSPAPDRSAPTPSAMPTAPVAPMTRRRWLGLALGGATATLSGCAPGDRAEAAAQALRRPLVIAPATDADLRLRALLRYATLAPSSHNTQCWRFRLAPDAISISADRARRCPVVDPDDHHLFVSLGCAAENLVHAALAQGLHAEVATDAAGAIGVALTPTAASETALFRAIPARQCTRGEFDGRPVAASELRQLEQAGTGPGVRVLLLTERPALETVLDFVVAGNTAQLDDPAFVAELKAWIRFDADEALRTGDGLYAAASGNPTLPRWIGSRLLGLVLRPGADNARYARQIRGSAGIAVFIGERADPAHWVEVGRCYERFALLATALDIRTAMLNQPVEVAALRPQFAAALGLDGLRPDLVLRFGRGPMLPWSLRRPVAAVLA